MSVTVACPSCATRFKMDKSAIPQEGRMVKCSSCFFKWRLFPHQLHHTHTEEEWSSESYKRIKNKQEQEVKKKTIYYILFIIFFWVSLFIFTFFFRQKIIQYIPQMVFFYEKIGIKTKKTGISLLSPFLEEAMDKNGKKILYIQGTLINTNPKETLPIPPLRITLRDKANFIIKDYMFTEFSSAELRPGGIEEFSYQIDKVSPKAVDVSLELSIK